MLRLTRRVEDQEIRRAGASCFSAGRSHSWMTLALLASLLPSCANEIGDSCSTNIDCSTSGDRICDTAQRDGYCTIQGCGATTCPGEAVCISFYPENFLSTPCDPETEDSVAIAEPTNDCLGSEICLSSGVCASFAQERRFCMKRCKKNGDCRNGYECRQTGTLGAELVRDRQRPERTSAGFCAQVP